MKAHHHLSGGASSSCSSFVRRHRSVPFDHEDYGRGRCSRRAFTLIELLVVIAIIGILAGLSLAAFAAVKNKATFKRVEGELAQLENAIETYKIDKGFYPPDNSFVANATEANLYENLTTPASRNSLFYELGGATRGAGGKYRSLVDNVDVPENILQTTFNVGGVMNASAGGGGPKKYLQTFKSTQYSHSEDHPDLRPPSPLAPSPPGVMVMSTIVKGPTAPDSGPSRFCYVTSSRWQRNPQTFDLWVDVIVRGKTNRVSNWSEKPEIVSY